MWVPCVQDEAWPFLDIRLWSLTKHLCKIGNYWCKVLDPQECSPFKVHICPFTDHQPLQAVEVFIIAEAHLCDFVQILPKKIIEKNIYGHSSPRGFLINTKPLIRN